MNDENRKFSYNVSSKLSFSSCLQNLQKNISETFEPSSSTAEIQSEAIINFFITPEVIKPNLAVVLNRKTNKGRKPGTFRISV